MQANRSKKKHGISSKNAERHIQLGLNVALYRKQTDTTQEQLAKKAGISWAYLCKIESPDALTNITVGIVFNLAKALDLPPHKLLEFRD